LGTYAVAFIQVIYRPVGPTMATPRHPTPVPLGSGQTNTKLHMIRRRLLLWGKLIKSWPLTLVLRYTRSTYFLDVSVVVLSLLSDENEYQQPLVGGQWFLNLLSNQAWASSSRVDSQHWAHGQNDVNPMVDVNICLELW